MVLVLTLAKTFQHWRQMRQLKLSASVASLLIRDGKNYNISIAHVELTALRRDFIGTLYFL